MRAADAARIRAEALRTLCAVDPRRLWLTIADQRNGFPSGGYDPVSGGGSDDTPTERAALHPDHAAQALHDLQRILHQLDQAMAQLSHLDRHYMAAPRRAMCQNCGDSTGDRYRTHCRWCTSWLNDTGQLPGTKEIAQRQMGGKPRRPNLAA